MKSVVKFCTVVLSILFGLNPASASIPKDSFVCKSTFTDLEIDTPTCYYANFLDYNRIISGYSDLTFRPENTVTRGEFSKFVVNAFGISTNVEIPNQTIPNPEQEPSRRDQGAPEWPETIQNPDAFPDVSEENVFLYYIYALKNAGIINGYSDGEFKTDKFVTREQATKFILNSINENYSDLKKESNLEFDDVAEDNKFVEYISILTKASEDLDQLDQIIDIPTEENAEFRPEDFLTRAELAKMVTNAMHLLDIHPRSDLDSLGTLKSGIKPNKTYSSNGYSVMEFDNYGLTLISARKPFNFIYMPNDAPTISEALAVGGYDFVINGSFFGGSHSNADHAGFLNLDGLNVTPLKEYEEDRQLSHIVEYNYTLETVDFLELNDFEEKTGDSNYTQFQTGPMVIKNSNIESDFIFNSKNGRSAHKRTLLGISSYDRKEKIFFIFRTEVSLAEAAHIIMHLEHLKYKPLTVINLDGGSSTSIVSKNYPSINYGENKQLPIVIGF